MFQNLNILKVLVLGIIITLAAGAIVFAFTNAKADAADERRLADVGKIQEALTLFFDVNGFYPNNSDGVPKGIDQYLSFYPTPPNPNGNCTKESNNYFYERKASGMDFNLSFCLGKDGKHTITSKGLQ